MVDDITTTSAAPSRARGASNLALSAHALLSFLGAFAANDARHLTQQLEAQAHEHIDRTIPFV
jgi:hypothetical protein